MFKNYREKYFKEKEDRLKCVEKNLELEKTVFDLLSYIHDKKEKEKSDSSLFHGVHRVILSKN